MPFTLNFTITNLTFEEDMQHPGSWKFNATELILQGLVRAPPINASPPTNTSPTHFAPAPPTTASPTHLTY